MYRCDVFGHQKISLKLVPFVAHTDARWLLAFRDGARHTDAPWETRAFEQRLTVPTTRRAGNKPLNDDFVT
jgi:hypothetical protein